MLRMRRYGQLPSTPRFISALGVIDTLLGMCCGRARPATRGAHPDLSSTAERQSTFLTLLMHVCEPGMAESYLNGVSTGCSALLVVRAFMLDNWLNTIAVLWETLQNNGSVCVYESKTVMASR